MANIAGHWHHTIVYVGCVMYVNGPRHTPGIRPYSCNIKFRIKTKT